MRSVAPVPIYPRRRSPCPSTGCAPPGRRCLTSFASRLPLGQRPFLVSSASCFVAGHAAVSSPVAGLRPHLLKPRLSVIALAGNATRSGRANIRHTDGAVSKEFTEFCKALGEHLSVEDMCRILQANGQDTSGSEDAVVSRCEDMIFYGSFENYPICGGQVEFKRWKYSCTCYCHFHNGNQFYLGLYLEELFSYLKMSLLGMELIFGSSAGDFYVCCKSLPILGARSFFIILCGRYD